VIFMITAPLMQQGVDINLPKEATTPVVIKAGFRSRLNVDAILAL